MSFQNPTHEEALYLAGRKRKAAVAALGEIVSTFRHSLNTPLPSLTSLLDYYNNMIYAIELLLKVASDDWKDAGKSKNCHNVRKMYSDAFGREYGNPNLLDAIKDGIVNQKFLLEPATGLGERIPHLEDLWEDIVGKYVASNWAKNIDVRKEATIPAATLAYISANLEKYFQTSHIAFPPAPFLPTRKGFLQYELAQIESRKRILECELGTLGEQGDDEHLDYQRRMEEESRSQIRRNILDRITHQANGVPVALIRGSSLTHLSLG